MPVTPAVLVTDALEAAKVPFELLEHPATMTATAEAEALGLHPHDVAKTIVVEAPTGRVRVMLPASERIDMRKLRELLGGGKELQLLDKHELGAAYPEFEVGAVPPIGGPTEAVLIDRRLAERPSLVLEAGAHDRSLRVATDDLVALAGARICDLCLD